MTNNSNIRNKVIFISVIFIVACILGSVTLMVLHHFHSAFADTEKCQTCKGSGQVSVSVPCSACNGEGKIGDVITCIGCNGNGTITSSCDSCGGNGTVETSCSICGGSGMISGGMDEEGNPIEEPCGCGGGMVSDTCGGCAGAGSFSETCGGCSGNGIIDERPTCEVCSGSGSVQSQTSTLSFPQVSDCYFRYKIGDGGDWVTDYSSYSYTESSLPFTVTTEITKMNVVDKLWRGFKAGMAYMNMPTNFTPVFTYTIDSFEDLTFSPIFEESCRISFSSSTNYDFEFKINGNGISIAPTDWISVSSAVGQNYLFTRGNVVSIRNIDILSLGLILDKFTFSSNPTDSSGNSLFQVITAVDPNDGAEYYLSTNPNVSEDLVSTSVTLALKNFTIDVWPLFSFDEYDSFSGLPVVSSFKSDNLSHPILSFPFELEDLGTVLYNQYTNKLNTFDIPYWVFEDGSLVTFPLTLESAVKHKSLFPYVKGLKSHPYSMSIEGFAVNAYSNVKAYIVYQNLTDNTPVQPSYGLVTSSGASNPLIALRSPLYYTDAEDIYLCVTKSYNPYIEILYNGTIIYSEQVAKYSATSSDADFYPLKNAIEKANTLFGSASEARDKLLTLQYISFSFKDVGTSQASQHIVLHFDETNVWQPNLMDSFSFFETIFKGVVSALDVYIAPNITLLSILSVVLAIGILLFIFRMSGII